MQTRRFGTPLPSPTPPRRPLIGDHHVPLRVVLGASPFLAHYPKAILIHRSRLAPTPVVSPPVSAGCRVRRGGCSRLPLFRADFIPSRCALRTSPSAVYLPIGDPARSLCHSVLLVGLFRFAGVCSCRFHPHRSVFRSFLPRYFLRSVCFAAHASRALSLIPLSVHVRFLAS